MKSVHHSFIQLPFNYGLYSSSEVPVTICASALLLIQSHYLKLNNNNKNKKANKKPNFIPKKVCQADLSMFVRSIYHMQGVVLACRAFLASHRSEVCQRKHLNHQSLELIGSSTVQTAPGSKCVRGRWEVRLKKQQGPNHKCQASQVRTLDFICKSFNQFCFWESLLCNGERRG